jgi:hypothetical protein
MDPPGEVELQQVELQQVEDFTSGGLEFDTFWDIQLIILIHSKVFFHTCWHHWQFSSRVAKEVPSKNSSTIFEFGQMEFWKR